MKISFNFHGPHEYILYSRDWSVLINPTNDNFESRNDAGLISRIESSGQKRYQWFSQVVMKNNDNLGNLREWAVILMIRPIPIINRNLLWAPNGGWQEKSARPARLGAEHRFSQNSPLLSAVAKDEGSPVYGHLQILN